MKFALLVLLALSTTAPAQVTISSSLRGRVTDGNGAAVSDAQVTLTNSDTDAVFSARTDGDGQYFFARVAAGRYKLAAEREGFKRLEQHIVITVNESAVANLTLAVGQVSEAVTVSAGTTVVQSDRADLSALVDERRVRELPLNGKSFLKLVQFSPGVGSAAPGAFTANNLPISGARPSANTYAVDGVNFNDERFDSGLSGAGGASSFTENAPTQISSEAIQELRIITSNADATFGRGSGGQINIITKSGGNRFHGSAYEHLRNDALDARDFFNNGPFFDARGRSKTPPHRQHLYGASLGGPIKRDRHFFFGNYEGFHQRRATPSRSRASSTRPASIRPRASTGHSRRCCNSFTRLPPRRSWSSAAARCAAVRVTD